MGSKAKSPSPRRSTVRQARRWPSLRVLRARYGARVLFSLAVFLLIALASWWLLLIGQSIRSQHQMSMQLMDRDVYVAAMRLGFHPERLAVGLMPGDDHLEISQKGMELRAPARWVGDGTEVTGSTTDTRRQWIVQPSKQWADAVSATYDRRKGMVIGEGLMLTSLLAIVVAMLYHLIRTEAKFRREMQDFLGRATHEMKTPLAGIKAVLQTLQAGRIQPEAQRDLIKLALVELDREEHLVQNMLLAQRLRLPTQQLSRERVEVRPLLERFAAHRRETLGDAVALRVEASGDPVACGDPTALWTVLENLADNAVKYGAQHLTARAELEGRTVQIALQDDGMGFEADQARQLFDAFSASAGHQVGKHGTGLGLSICRSLLQRMAGKIEARSEGPGKGATFLLTLPVWREPSH